LVSTFGGDYELSKSIEGTRTTFGKTLTTAKEGSEAEEDCVVWKRPNSSRLAI
jgi:hypothetical protein